MPKDREAEQGDFDGPPECSVALGMVAAEARLCVATQQAARTLSQICADDSLREKKQRDRMQKIQNFQIGGPEKRIGADDS